MSTENPPELYYVSVTSKNPAIQDESNLLYLMSGPYTEHSSALSDVDKVRDIAYEVDHKSWFYWFGTVRMKAGYDTPGILNKLDLI